MDKKKRIKNKKGPVREVRIVALQSGPVLGNQDRIESFLGKISEFKPNFIVTSELFKHPYWAGIHDDRFFKWAEPIPGQTTSQFGEIAKRLGSYFVVSIFEKGNIAGEYYDSAVVLDPEGNIIRGKMTDGKEVDCYRKNHIPLIRVGDYLADEKYYFKPGPGFPVFHTEICVIGILVCYDRAFPEAWRVLALQGAEIIFVPVASAGWREKAFIKELQTRAIENGIFVVACNKGGREVLEGHELLFFGNSCIINPFGEVIIKGPTRKGPSLLKASIDLNQVQEARLQLPVFRDRRPELYGDIIGGPRKVK